MALAFGLAWYMFARRTPVYLVDFSVLKPPEEWKVCIIIAHPFLDVFVCFSIIFFFLLVRV